MKDLRTGAILHRGPNKDDVYEFPASVQVPAAKPLAMVGEKAPMCDWHKGLGHPSSRILKYIRKL